MLERDRMLFSAGHRKAAGGFRPEPILVSGSPFEVTLFNAGAGHAEVGAVTQHGEQDVAKPMGHGDHCGFVTTPDANLGEVRMQRMRGPPRVMRRLAEHRPQLSLSAFGDVAVGVSLT